MVPWSLAYLAAAATVGTGISSWHSSTSASPSTVRSSLVSSVIESLAPPTTMMLFSPLSSTTMSAIPLEPGTVRSRVVPTLEPANTERSCSEKMSSPTAPRNSTRPPARPAARAWFAPFPPGTVVKPRPSTVSPGSGRRCVLVTRSMLMLPRTAITGLLRLAVTSGTLVVVGRCGSLVSSGQSVGPPEDTAGRSSRRMRKLYP